MGKVIFKTSETAANKSGAMEDDTISKNGVGLKCRTSRRNIMLRIFLLFVIFCTSMSNMFAQDVITLKNGEDIQALVQEINDADIKYKKFENPSGPNYTLKKSEIVKIQYANGSIDEFAVRVPIATENAYEQPAITNQDTEKQVMKRGTKAGKESWKKLQDFENKMKDQGFTKRVVAYDFLPQYNKNLATNEFNWWSVGIWINFEKQLIALRLEKDNWQEVYIPFDKIQSLEIDEGIFEKVRVQEGIFQWHVTANEKSTRFYVRIVTGDIQRGTEAYILKFYDAKLFSFRTSDAPYQAMRKCAQSIYDEINNIFLYTR